MSKQRRKILDILRPKSTTDLSEWNKNDEKLLKAVDSGDVKKVTAILTKKTLNPTKLGPRGHNVFHLACAVGNELIVDVLLKYSDDVSDLTIQGTTALQLAAAKGHTNIVERLLQVNADVDMVDSNNMTALHHACAGLHLECVQVLLMGNASPQTKEKTGKTPLFYTAHRGDVAICKWLVDKGADVNAADMYQMTPLIVASKEGHREVVEFLLKKGAIPDHMDREGRTALMCAMMAGHHSMREVFAKAPTRASWDVHPGSHKTNAVVPQDTPPKPESEVASSAKIDMVDKFSDDSPLFSHKDCVSGDETESRSSTQSNHIEERPTAEMKKQYEVNLVSHSIEHEKTKQALKELEEEHEQLNEEFHRLSVEKLKMQDKVDFLGCKLQQIKQEESERAPMTQEVEDELSNLRNLLDEEQERSRDLAFQLLHNTEEEKRVILSCSKSDGHRTQVAAVNGAEGQGQGGVLPIADSWGDSDEDLYESSANKQKSPMSNHEDTQVVMLLRSQILAVRQENDQLKEKLQSLPNGFCETTPYILQSEKETLFTSGTDELQSLRNKISTMEADKEDLNNQLLKAKESSEMNLFAEAVNHEELVVENKHLKEQVETLQNRLVSSHLSDSESHKDLLEQNRRLTAELEVMQKSRVDGNQPGSASQEDLVELNRRLTTELGVMRSKLDCLEQQHAEHEHCSSVDGDSGDSGISGVKPDTAKTPSIAFLQAQNDQLTDQCSLLTEELDKLRITFDAILKAGDNLQTDYDVLQNDKEKLQEELERTVQEKEELVKENEFLLSDGNALHDDLKKLVHELEKMQDRLKQVEKEKEKEKEASVRLSTAVNLSGKVGEFSRLLEERDGLKQQLDELTTEWTRVQHDQEILVEEVQSLQEQLATLSDERDKLQTEADDVETLLQQHDVLQQDYTQLEQDYAELLKEKEKVEEELLDGQGGTITVEDSGDGVTGELVVSENRTLSYEKEQLEMTVMELSRANALVQEQLGQLQQELDHTQRQLQQLQQRRGEEDVDVTLQSAVVRQKDEQLQGLQDQVSRLQTQLTEFDRNHKDVVGMYRTHLISAVQGHMDSSVKEALHQIIELRSMEQFC